MQKPAKEKPVTEDAELTRESLLSLKKVFDELFPKPGHRERKSDARKRPL